MTTYVHEFRSTYREDGTDETYCGQPEQDHEWSGR